MTISTTIAYPHRLIQMLSWRLKREQHNQIHLTIESWEVIPDKYKIGYSLQCSISKPGHARSQGASLARSFPFAKVSKEKPYMGIFMSKDSDYTIRAYCDSDWVACPDSRKSVGIWCYWIGEQSCELEVQKTRNYFLVLGISRVLVIEDSSWELVWLGRIF